MNDFPEVFQQFLLKPLLQDVPLRDHSTFRIGGRARYFFEAESLPDLMAAVKLCRRLAQAYYLIGWGSNLLFDDAGFDGLIIKNSCRGVSLRAGEEVEVISGNRLSGVVEFAAANSLEGMEFLAGIPGTLGGAVFGNAGAFGKSIGDLLKEAVLLGRQGEEIAVGADYFQFGYRRSSLRTSHDVLLRAVFGLRRGEEAVIRARMAENLAQRRANHPPAGTACAGCYFKNPVLPDGRKVSAGKALDETGAKTLTSGGAAVSAQHGNFIINEGQARAEDVLRLAEELKKRVREKCGYELEEEVIFLPAASSMP
jgi:UDP-N-acetylmuramate dehydrogenase